LIQASEKSFEKAV